MTKQKSNQIPTNQSIEKKTLIPNNLTVMVALIPLVRILENPYKISIKPPEIHYVKLLGRFLWIYGSIMIDQTNTTESESVGDLWSMYFS